MRQGSVQPRFGSVRLIPSAAGSHSRVAARTVAWSALQCGGWLCGGQESEVEKLSPRGVQ